MSLDFAILGFLNYQPFTGYDLKRIFEDSIRHFWYADQSQIYRTLNRLLDQNLVTQELVEQEDRPDRKVYHITDEGKQALRNWLVSKPEVDAPKSAPLIQVFFAGQFENEVILQMFRFMDQVMQELMENYGRVPEVIEGYRAMVKSDREIYFWKSTLDLGMRVGKAQQEWARDVIDDLENNRVPEK
ncbi:MAG: PadR family transcriptional regulator [Chloroflexi bacterium]|nr:PadR family transcriptional regulator [Chloroflexota bacterium]